MRSAATSCIPVQADLSLDIPMQSVLPRHAGDIARFMRLVPQPPEKVSGLKIANVSVDDGAKPRHLVVDVICEDPARPMDIFVEGSQSLFFGVPVEVAGAAAGQKRFRIPVDNCRRGGRIRWSETSALWWSTATSGLRKAGACNKSCSPS